MTSSSGMLAKSVASCRGWAPSRIGWWRSS